MSQYSKRKFSLRPDSTFERHKRPHVGPNFSDLPTHLPDRPTHPPNLPTHLPGSSISFAPSSSSNFPTSSIAKTSDSGRTVESGELPEKILENTLIGQTKDENSKIVTTEPCISQVVASSKTNKADQKKDASADPIFIEGTNITLQTEEDIAQWIAERRKNWPTRKNVETKLQEQKKDSENVQLSSQQNICKFFAKSRSCKFGTKCRNAHETTNNESEKAIIKANKNSQNTQNTQNTQFSQNQRTSGTRKMINGVLVNVPQRYKQDVNGSGSLFTKLVQRDLYEHENNVIIDFIQYLDSKGLINIDVSF